MYTYIWLPINIQASSEDKTEEDKDRFSEEIEQESGHKASYSKHDISNDNDRRIISFAAEFDLTVVSTKFQHKEIYKGTWLALNKKYVNQIDRVQHTKNVIDVQSYQGTEADTDHFLVIATFKQSQNKKRKRDTRKYHQIKMTGLQEPEPDEGKI
ncbi:hypothetical protein QE152_g33725 [Popillia japonica]|uniref:Uncharacterized protein n=1 Tax=Popillia japonica TaxID=7064 RepID=A0AAW1IVU8_POPJA